MFDYVRNNSRIFLGVLVVLIALSFVGGGMQGYESMMSNDTVAKVAGTKISQAEWDGAVSKLAERIRSQAPETDAALFDTPEFKQRALDTLVRDYTLMAAVRDQRLSVPDTRLKRVFMTLPEFAAVRNPDGSLNTALLQAQGISSEQFAGQVRQQLGITQVLGGVEQTGLPLKVPSRLAVDALFQVRDVQWMKFEPKNYVAQLNPTPEQLRKFFDEPAMNSVFMQPESADVQYVVLDLDVLKKRVTISEDDLRKSYQENLKLYTQDEERRASHILIKAEKSASAAQRQAAKAKAEQLLAQVNKSPAGFAELARKNSEDPGSAANGGDLDFFGRGAMVKPFEEATFSLKKGQISGVVESDFGYHIIMLTDVRGGAAQSFEEVRPQIEDQARKQLALRAFAEAAEKFTNTVYEQADSLEPVVKELKLELQTASGVMRKPGTKDQGLLGNQRVLEALFDATNRSKGRNTEAIEVAPNKLVSARVVKYHPAAKPAFDAVQAQVRERWIARESAKAARADADQKMALWKASPDKSQMPAGVQMSRRLVFSQPPQVLDAVLRTPEKQLPAWQVVDIGAEGFALIKVNKVLPVQISPEEEQETRRQFGSYWAKAEADAYMRALKREYKLDIKVKPPAKASEADKAASSR
jgi:peptidyl-prolyl cis-trans isomerase D